ncbi:STAS domain-containing protein [Actinomadura opuntiae]|uniref:STAS domain-containing protein n=1 Tax=Actinomadura sp. OS1-43 TaxID=604315 RepID=UPI00255A819A|nr:STAS domain-containing protein [Actinomadura sp. OS1-43]MDL4814434.1 STAS domain-containing protein [Actinomadura sp. OS1-43]
MSGADRVPVLRLEGVLLTGIQTELTDDVAAALRDDLLAEVAAAGADGAIIDITAVQVIDSYLARVLTEIAAAVRLMGARTVVAGMKPAVAITLVEMGLDLPGVVMCRSLSDALRTLAVAAPGGVRPSAPADGPR